MSPPAAGQLAVRPLATTAELDAAAGLLAGIWREPGGPISSDVLSALVLSRNYVAGVYDASGRLVAASVAWASPEPVELHSHLTGVERSARGRGVGLALKLHQRAWARERRIASITWTFDPLQRANAWFNLVRLGAVAERYLENLYGRMDDSVNGDDDSDRLLVRWDVSGDDPGAPRRAPSGSAPVLVAGSDGRPVETPAPAARRVAVAVPADVEALRRRDPVAVGLWRSATRRLIGGALSGNGRLLGLDEEGRYVLERTGGSETG
ncbi:MAG TPA: hypothetical protein VFN50_08325 [Acidimicrobiales bacterium]|nr:hypothetical protein [Acidimicrobiales bacterium]